jgi:hypothetical protein
VLDPPDADSDRWRRNTAFFWPEEKGDIGPWLIWALRDGAWKHRQWASAADLDAFFHRSADELGAAMNEGRLARRWAPFAFVPPDWRELADVIPDALNRTWLSLRRRQPHWTPESGNVSAAAVKAYDRVLLRRPELVERLRGDDADGPRDTSVSAGFAWRVREVLERSYRPTWYASVIVGLLAGLSVGVRVFRRRLESGHVAVAMLIVAVLGAVALRFVFVTVINAAGIPALPRYVLPLSMLMMFGAVVGVELLLTRPGARASAGAASAKT